MKPLSTIQKILAAAFLLVIASIALFRLIESPPFAFDEGWATQVGMNIARFGADGLQFAPGTFTHVSVLTSVGYTLIYALAFWLKIFGVGVFQARLMMVVYMLVFAALAFLLARRLFGNRLALVSLALLATLPPFYAFGKQIIGEVPLLTFMTLCLLSLNLAFAGKRRRFWFVIAGLSAGLCIVTKTSALAFAPVLVICAVIAYRRKLVAWSDILTMFVAAIPPFIVWIAVNFQHGDTLASVLDYYSNPAAVTNAADNFHHNLKLLFTTPGTLFALALVAVWLAGIIVRLAKRLAVPIEEWIAIVYSVVVLCAFMRLYGDARYIFPVGALAILFAPRAAEILLESAISIPEKLRGRIILACAGLIALLGLYQLGFHSFVADSYADTSTDRLAAYMAALPSDSTVFFYNATYAVPFFHGTNYYQRIVMFEKWQLGSDFASLVAKKVPDILVINTLSKSDQSVPFTGYAETDTFGQIQIYKKTGK